MAARFPIVLANGELVELPVGDNLNVGPLTSYSPTIGTDTGSITTLGTVIGEYLAFGKLLFLYLFIPITTNGSGAGFIYATLPFTAKSGRYYVLNGKEVGVLGVVASGTINPFYNSSRIIIQKYDGSYIGGDGYKIVVGGFFEMN